MTNSNDGAGYFIAGLLLFAFSPIIFFAGFASGQANVREHNQMVMSQVLAKGCIEKPQECKTYRDFYVAVEKFKND